MRDPIDLIIELSPDARFDVLDLRSRFSTEDHEALAPYPRCLYWSAHTTAGFLDRSLTARLGPTQISTYVETLRRIFPEHAGYEHDRLERRTDLDPAQRAVEPPNGDSHLAFIAGGLRPCVMHPNDGAEPVYFLELDGVHAGQRRRRVTRVIGFNREVTVAEMRIDVPVSGHPIDSINLKDPRLGIYPRLSEFVARAGAGTGRLHLALDRDERHAALTVNEFETLLMKFDLPAVLRSPLRFMAAQYRGAMSNPRAVPSKALGYAQYDLVRVFNSSLDTLRLQNSIVEKVLARTLAVPASRFFRIRRSVSLLVAEREDGCPGFVEGPYQSPILVQWARPARRTRVLDVTLTRVE